MINSSALDAAGMPGSAPWFHLLIIVRLRPVAVVFETLVLRRCFQSPVNKITLRKISRWR
jgi:hypothetical protein